MALISSRPPGSFHGAGLAFGEDAEPVVDIFVSDVVVGVTLIAAPDTAVAVVLGVVNHAGGLP